MDLLVKNGGTTPLRPAALLLFVHLVQFSDAASQVLVSAERGVEVGFQYLLRHLDADHPGAHARHVDVVVLHTLVRTKGVVDQRGADAGDFVAGDCQAPSKARAASSANQPVSESAGTGSALRTTTSRLTSPVVDKATHLNAKMAPGGGYAVRLVPVKP